jgi:hypothetical protein
MKGTRCICTRTLRSRPWLLLVLVIEMDKALQEPRGVLDEYKLWVSLASTCDASYEPCNRCRNRRFHVPGSWTVICESTNMAQIMISPSDRSPTNPPTTPCSPRGRQLAPAGPPSPIPTEPPPILAKATGKPKRPGQGQFVFPIRERVRHVFSTLSTSG